MKIALIGTAPTSVRLAPYMDKEWDIWACSAGNMKVLPRVNIWFEMHPVSVMMSDQHRAMAEPFFQWLREMSDAGTFNVVMLEVNQFVPKAVPYPIHEMLAEFGHNWFTSSIAYMMALAITRMKQRPNEDHTIGLFGVDMAAGEEHYTQQRAGCIRFMEFARAAGIKVVIPMESSLGEPPPLYGYAEGTPLGRRLAAVRAQAEAGRAALAAQVDRQRLEMAYFDGALEQLRYLQATWLDGSEAELDFGALTDKAKANAERYFASPLAGRNAETAVTHAPPATKPALAAVTAPPPSPFPAAPGRPEDNPKGFSEALAVGVGLSDKTRSGNGQTEWPREEVGMPAPPMPAAVPHNGSPVL